MKFNLSFLALLLPLTVVFTSCKKDKEEQTNYFTYEGKTYSIVQAMNASDEGYSSTFFTSGNMQTTSGKMSLINITFGTTGLQAGTYTFKSITDDAFDAAKNFGEANAAIDIVYENGTVDEQSGTQLDDLTAGSVTITKDGTNYKFNYELNFNGKIVSGKYSGAIQDMN